MNIYRYTFKAKCPNNDQRIAYELTLESPTMVMVEKITGCCDELVSGFHEDLADLLLLKLGGKQTIRAHHHGVDVETVRGAL